jgi:glutathione synthase/RimK-type ligase-like ATP-grasp enzyme
MPDVRLVTAETLPVEDTDLPIVAGALAARDLDVHIAAWSDATVDWSDAPVSVLRSPWDYVERLDEFLAWSAAAGTATALWNPPGLVAWNTHKSYLLELAASGAPIVPTVVLPRGSAGSLDGIADAQGWNAVVVKPAVGVGGNGAGRFDVGDRQGQEHFDTLLQDGEVLVQQYAGTVEAHGELSIICFEGRAAHAVRKLPAAGEFRIHEHRGGTVVPVDLADVPAALAERVCSVLPAPTLYARVDLLRMGEHWCVVEVEATEPRLFLWLAPPESTDRLVDAIITRTRAAAS